MKRRKSILIATVFILFVSAVAVWAETDKGLIPGYEIAGSVIKDIEADKNETVSHEAGTDEISDNEAIEKEAVYTDMVEDESIESETAYKDNAENESDEADTQESETADIEIASDSNYKPESEAEAVNEEKEAAKEAEKELKNGDFEIEENKLIKYHGSDEYVVVPEGVEIIGEGAFRGNSAVIELVLPDSTTYAESEAFAYMANLVTIERGAFFATDTGDVYEGSDKLQYYNTRDNGY